MSNDNIGMRNKGFRHNTLVNITDEYMGSHSVLFVPTVVAVYELKGPPCTHFSNLILNDFTLQGISLCYTSDWSAHG